LRPEQTSSADAEAKRVSALVADAATGAQHHPASAEIAGTAASVSRIVAKGDSQTVVPT
jgi:hypothetical protein